MEKNKMTHKKAYCTAAFLGVAMILYLIFLSYEIERKERLKPDMPKEEETEEKIDYTTDMVKGWAESVLIKTNSAILYGEDLWDSFLKDTEDNKESHICLYFTENEYNISNYIDLTYDGDCFTVKKYKSKEEEQYKYLYCFEDTDKMFLLMNEEGITYQEYERRRASSTSRDWLEECILFGIFGNMREEISDEFVSENI